MLESFISILSGTVMPVLLLGTGLVFSFRLRFFWIAHPIRCAKLLLSGTSGDGQTPLRAMTVALAGTLGVGNIAGVATAISAGGAGAVFWMWVSATLAMGVKYAEVTLAVAHRRTETAGGTKSRYGGAMYYIRDMISPAAGGFFAVLCMANALITGNILQVNAAASVCAPVIPPVAVGIVMAVLCAAVTVGSAKRISDVTVRLIPILSIIYIVLSLGIIASHIGEVPGLLAKIVRDAFGIRPLGGGMAGVSVAAAIRYGVTRGILSNEAGSGTSPTAHASADTNDPHRQGVFGIFEVFADTVIICTLTAFVILLLPEQAGEDGVRLAALAYSTFAGEYAGYVISGSVVMFAFATVICQAYYGMVAVGYFSRSPRAKRGWLWGYSITCVIGSLISPSVMWSCADLCIAGMTAFNTAVLMAGFLSERYRREMLPDVRR